MRRRNFQPSLISRLSKRPSCLKCTCWTHRSALPVAGGERNSRVNAPTMGPRLHPLACPPQTQTPPQVIPHGRNLSARGTPLSVSSTLNHMTINILHEARAPLCPFNTQLFTTYIWGCGLSLNIAIRKSGTMDKNISSCSHVEDATPEQSSQSMWYSVRHNSKAVFFCIGPCIGSMLWGFDIGSYRHIQSIMHSELTLMEGVNSISTALPGFKLVFGYEYEGQLLVSATWNALWTAMTSLGMLLGGIACGYLSDRFGRQVGFLAGSACSIVGVGVEYVASTPGVLLAGKIVCGRDDMQIAV